MVNLFLGEVIFGQAHAVNEVATELIPTVLAGVAIVALPEVKERLDAIGFVPVANSPEEFAAVIKAETERWGKVIRAAGIKAE